MLPVTCLCDCVPSPGSTMQQVTASWHLQRGPGWLTPSSLVHFSQCDSGLCCKLKAKPSVLALNCLFLAVFRVLSCFLACPVNRFSRIFHDSIVGSKVSQGVDSHGSVPTKVICFIAVFGAALWVVRFAPHTNKPKDLCVQDCWKSHHCSRKQSKVSCFFGLTV
jgi:hypothetical protein